MKELYVLNEHIDIAQEKIHRNKNIYRSRNHNYQTAVHFEKTPTQIHLKSGLNISTIIFNNDIISINFVSIFYT